MRQMLEYAMQAYGFVLNRGKFTGAQFADKIEEVYSLDTPQNRAVFDFVKSLTGEFEVTHTSISYTGGEVLLWQ